MSKSVYYVSALHASSLSMTSQKARSRPIFDWSLAQGSIDNGDLSPLLQQVYRDGLLSYDEQRALVTDVTCPNPKDVVDFATLDPSGGSDLSKGKLNFSKLAALVNFRNELYTAPAGSDDESEKKAGENEKKTSDTFLRVTNELCPRVWYKFLGYGATKNGYSMFGVFARLDKTKALTHRKNFWPLPRDQVMLFHPIAQARLSFASTYF